ncbi:MAG: RnfABCDGE type electron transport complex subunit C, partial [Bacillota bacterium]
MKATFRFGIHPKDKKDITKNLVSEIMLPGEKVYIPLSQHIGAPSKPVVVKGDEVKAGTLIGEAASFISANVFSSVSGMVEGIVKRENVNGQKDDHICIANDKRYEEENMPPLHNPSPEDIVKRTKDAGIVGMGGACFPTHVKLMPKNPIKYLIINGAECEPYITADYRLMLERGYELAQGIRQMKKALKAEYVYLAIEDNKPKAIEEMQKFCKDDIKIQALKTKYPQGGEKQLIYALTRLEVPKGGLPSDVGCVVDNVANIETCYLEFNN